MNRKLYKVGIIVLCLGLILLFVRSCFSYDADEHFIDNYYKHKTDFNNLIKMFTDDKGLERVGDGFTRPANTKTISLTTDRVDQYHKIFKGLNIDNGIEGYDEKDIIWLHVASRGLSISGSSKGYVYADSSSLPKYGKIVNSLENYNPPDNESYTIFRHIEGKWYLYFDFED